MWAHKPSERGLPQLHHAARWKRHLREMCWKMLFPYCMPWTHVKLWQSSRHSQFWCICYQEVRNVRAQSKGCQLYMKSTSHRSCSAVSPSPWVHEASESFVSRSVLHWRLWSRAKMTPKQFECIHFQTTVQSLLVLCELQESASFKPPAKVCNLHSLSSISFPSSKKMYWSMMIAAF